ncbi:hypothetical protein BMETH_147_0 [methanotrophic bacterial endosymbiont of Bathymodiolus sp.]|nr:hypothetical protein BMETH_147_0 [methanotrophic bacterial endosymbiont of Bathymodiolus sp.]
MGKTLPCLIISLIIEKHPHGRGEDAYTKPIESINEETPPRAWGRRTSARYGGTTSGNTPTGVGKTL